MAKGLGLRIDIKAFDGDIKHCQEEFEKLINDLNSMSEHNPIKVTFDNNALNKVIENLKQVSKVAGETNTKNLNNSLQETIKLGDAVTKSLGNIAKLKNVKIGDKDISQTEVYKNGIQTTNVTSTKDKDNKDVIKTATTENYNQALREVIKSEKELLSIEKQLNDLRYVSNNKESEINQTKSLISSTLKDLDNNKVNVDYNSRILDIKTQIEKLQNTLNANEEKNQKIIDKKVASEERVLTAQKQYYDLQKKIQTAEGETAKVLQGQYTKAQSEYYNAKKSFNRNSGDNEVQEKLRLNELEQQNAVAIIRAGVADAQNKQNASNALREQNELYNQAESSLSRQYNLKTQLLTAENQVKEVLEKQLKEEEKKTAELTSQLSKENQQKLNTAESGLVNKYTVNTAKVSDDLASEQQKSLYREAEQSLARQYEFKTKLITATGSYKRELQELLTKEKNITNEKTKQLSEENKQILALKQQNLDENLGLSTAKNNDANSIFGADLRNKMSKFTEWMVAGNLFMGITNQLQQGIQYVNQLNESLTEIAIVTGKNQEQVDALGESYNNLAQQLSVTTDELTKATVEFYRQGLSQDEVMTRMEATTKYAKISSMDMDESAKILTATVNSMGVDITKASDTFAYLGDATATGADEIGRAFQKVGGSANALGVDFDKVSSWIATISSKTREEAETIGNSIKSLMARYQQLREKGFAEDDGTQVNQVAKALATAGVNIIDEQTGQFRNMGTVMDELGKKWESLDNRQKAYIATNFAGTHQQARFLNLMESYKESVTLYEGAVNSAGVTQTKYNIWLQGTEAHMNKLIATSESLWSHLFDSNGIRSAIDVGTGFLNLLDGFVQKFGGLNSIIFTALGTLQFFNKELKAISITKSSNIGFNNGALQIDGWLKPAITNLKDFAIKMANATERATTFGQKINVFKNAKIAISEMGTALTVANAKMFALKIGAEAMNMALTMGLSMIIGSLVGAIAKAIDKTNEFKIANEQLLQNVGQNVMNNNNNIVSLQSMSAEYDSLTNKTSLTVAEHKRLLEMQNQIAEMSPDFIQGYDAEGNAQINLNKSTDEYVKLLKEKNKLENQKLVGNLNNGFTQFKNDIKSAKDALTEMENEKSKLSTKNTNNGIGLFADKAVTNGIKQTALSLEDLKNQYNDAVKAGNTGLIKELGNEVSIAEAKIQSADAQIATQKSVIQDSQNQFGSYINAIKNTSDAYGKLGDKSKLVADEMINGLDFSKFSSGAEAKSAIDAIINSFSKLDVDFKFSSIEDLKKKLADGKISLTDYNSQLNDLIDKLVKLLNIDGLDSDKLKHLLGLDNNGIKSATDLVDDLNSAITTTATTASASASEIKTLNTVLQKHAETGEWDTETILSLAGTYPQLLTKMGDDKALEEEIIKIKKDKMSASTQALQTVLQNIQKAINAYGVDVSNYANAESLKTAICQSEATKRARILANESVDSYANQLLTGPDASTYTPDEARHEAAKRVGAAKSYVEEKDNEAQTLANSYFNAKSYINGVQSGIGSVVGKTGSSGGGGSSAAMNEPEALVEKDRYYLLNQELTKTNSLLDENQSLQEGLDEKTQQLDIIKLKQQEIDLLVKKQENIDSVIREEKEEREELKNTLSSEGVTFTGNDDTLAMLNYEDVLSQKVANLNAHRNDKDKTYYNQLKTEYDSFKTATERFFDIQNTDMPKYIKEWHDAQTEIGKTKLAIEDMAEEAAKSFFEIEEANAKSIAELNIYNGKTQQAWEEANEKQQKKIQDKIDALQDEADAESEITTRIQNQNDLIELQTQLMNIKNNKSIQILKQNKDGSWNFSYVADSKAIADKQKEIDEKIKSNNEWEEEQERNHKIKMLEEQKQTLQDLAEQKNKAYQKENQKIEAHYADMDNLISTWMDTLKATYGDKWDEVLKVILEKLSSAKDLQKDLASLMSNIDELSNYTGEIPTAETQAELDKNKTTTSTGSGSSHVYTNDEVNWTKSSSGTWTAVDKKTGEQLKDVTFKDSHGTGKLDSNGEWKDSDGYYDKGGIGTGLGYMAKDTLKPERVLSPQQTLAFDKLVYSGVLDKIADIVPVFDNLIASKVNIPTNKSVVNEYKIDRIEFPNFTVKDEINTFFDGLNLYCTQHSTT